VTLTGRNDPLEISTTTLRTSAGARSRAAVLRTRTEPVLRTRTEPVDQHSSRRTDPQGMLRYHLWSPAQFTAAPLALAFALASTEQAAWAQVVSLEMVSPDIAGW